MQAQEPLDFLGNQDPMKSLIWENLIDDLNNAHYRIDTHEEHWDIWQHNFEVNTNQLSTWIFSTINDLRHTIEKQQNQIDELMMLS
jgi:hypothetical protein